MGGREDQIQLPTTSSALDWNQPIIIYRQTDFELTNKTFCTSVTLIWRTPICPTFEEDDSYIYHITGKEKEKEGKKISSKEGEKRESSSSKVGQIGFRPLIPFI